MEEQSIISYEINQSLIGSHKEVLIEGKSDIPIFHTSGDAQTVPEIDGIAYVKANRLTPAI